MASTVRITEICKITPPSKSTTESSLPLTFFDTFWLKFNPVEFIFFYELTADSPFFSSILPKLKQSLSLTLPHFLPFAGNLVWPPNFDKPFILYTPGDGIFLSVAESNADFHSLSGDLIRGAPDLHHYIPELNSSDSHSATISFQVTFFPNQGFCIGISCSKPVFDAKSLLVFLNAWAHICKHTGEDTGDLDLPPELSPYLDRAIIRDPEGLNELCLSLARQSEKGTNPISLKVQRATPNSNYVRATFKMTNEDINTIQQKVSISSKGEKQNNGANSKRFSRFVLVYAYVAAAMIKAKAKEVEQNKNWVLLFTADGRSRSDLGVPSNYLGNCIIPNYLILELGSLMRENGLLFVVEELTKLIKGLDNGALVGMKHKIGVLRGTNVTSLLKTGVAGSPRFNAYGIDFGWGKPKKVESTSIDNVGSILMVENRGENVLEVGVVLKKDEMNVFCSQFSSDFGKPNIIAHL